MKHQYAFEKLLGISGDYGVAEVNEAFRKAAIVNHPDHGGTGDMGALRDAKAQALVFAEARESLTDCVKCGGTGFKRGTGFAPARCTNCRGTGKQRRD